MTAFGQMVASLRGELKPFAGLLGLALVLTAAAHFFGFRLGFNGTPQELALIGIGLLLV